MPFGIQSVLFRLQALLDRALNARDRYTEIWTRAAIDAASKAARPEDAEEIERRLLDELRRLHRAASNLVAGAFRNPGPRARIAATLLLVSRLYATDVWAQDPCSATPRPANCPPSEPHERIERPEKPPEKVTIEKVENELGVDIYKKETEHADGSKTIEFFRDKEATEGLDTKVHVEPNSDGGVSVEMEIAGEESTFEVGPGEDGGVGIEGENALGEFKGTLHEDADGKTYSGEVTGTFENSDGVEVEGTAHVVIDKATGEIIDVDIVDDPTADS